MRDSIYTIPVSEVFEPKCGCPICAGRVKQSRLERYGRAAAEVGSSFRGHAVPKKLNKQR